MLMMIARHFLVRASLAVMTREESPFQLMTQDRSEDLMTMATPSSFGWSSWRPE